MKVLFATSIKSWGGGEQWMLSACCGMRERGHDVTLAARPGSAIAARAQRSGIPLIAIPFRYDFDLASFWNVFRFCAANRPDVLCVNMDRALRVAGSAARAAGVRCVIPRRGSEFPLKGGIVYRWSYRQIATAMIVNSQATARTLLRKISWRPAGRLHVLPNGVDLSRFENARPREQVREELNLPPHALTLLSIGELTSRKNPLALLHAMADLVPRYPHLCALLVGEGPLRHELQREAARAGLSDHLRLLGFRNDIPDLLHAGDVLVHTARVEGFGYVIAEAMAAALPVVATRSSSIPEIVDDGKTGILFDPEDHAALLSAIETYAADPVRRRRDGSAGLLRARAEFDLQRRLDELEAIFELEIRGTSRPSRAETQCAR
jgi:glycosyltransferase involved in cell wall biosynthesis